MRKCKGLRIAKTVLKKNRTEDLPNFKTYHKVTIIKMVYIIVKICKLINKINTESRNLPQHLVNLNGKSKFFFFKFSL